MRGTGAGKRSLLCQGKWDGIEYRILHAGEYIQMSFDALGFRLLLSRTPTSFDILKRSPRTAKKKALFGNVPKLALLNPTTLIPSTFHHQSRHPQNPQP